MLNRFPWNSLKQIIIIMGGGGGLFLIFKWIDRSIIGFDPVEDIDKVSPMELVYIILVLLGIVVILGRWIYEYRKEKKVRRDRDLLKG